MNKEIELDLSLSDHEDAVSVVTVISDMTVESGKQSVHFKPYGTSIKIPDVICLQKSRRGFFSKKKLWTKINFR